MGVNNMPENTRRYVVARIVDEELWYWGSYDDPEQANQVAREIGGTVIENGDM